jgi:hypothetical protein
MDVALHHSRIDTHPPTRHDPLVLRYFHDPIVNLSQRLRPDRQAPLPHGLGIRHLATAHTGEVAIHEISSHFAF